MKALIVDDELLPGKWLEELIKINCPEINKVNVMNSPIQVIEHLKGNHYDIIFLDIEMPEMNGLEFLEKAELNGTTELVFVTAHSSYAIDAFKVDATHYLLKPVDPKELILASQRAQKNLSSNSPSDRSSHLLSIYDGERYLMINQHDIIRMEADGSYTRIISDSNSNMLVSRRLGFYEKKLMNELFFRCHHSHLINIKKVSSIDRGKSVYVELKNGDKVPVSTSRRNELKSLLGV